MLQARFSLPEVESLQVREKTIRSFGHVFYFLKDNVER